MFLVVIISNNFHNRGQSSILIKQRYENQSEKQSHKLHSPSN